MREQILEILRRQKIAEQNKAKRDAFFQKAKAEFLRNQELRRQQELQRQALIKAKARLKPRTWGRKVW